jgi:phosphatidylserine decarboxylase
MSADSGGAPVFEERLTRWFAADAVTTAVPTLALSLVASGLGFSVAAVVLAAAGLFMAAFFRNPPRAVPSGPGAVVSPADGRVIAVGEVEGPDGANVLRIGIFLSVFNVHVNRAPVAGRVVSIERSGTAFLAAFNPDAETRNVRLAMVLELASGARVGVTQITGLIARRIVCHAAVGEWLCRGTRYGLIRFGSRTDVLLPATAEVRVREGQRVKGGRDLLAVLPGEPT